MDAAHKSQVNQIKKVFLVPFLLCISLAFLLFIYILAKSEYEEYFIYGQVKNGFVNNIFWENSTEGQTSHFFCVIDTYKNKLSYVIPNANQSFAISDEEKMLIENIEIGDTVKIKILNNKEAKILEWKQIIINEKNDYWGVLWHFISIFMSAIISCFLLKKIYQIYQQ